MREISEDNVYDKINLLRELISDTRFDCVKKSITISVGISLGKEYDDINNIMMESDKALYMAKKAGKNCVKVFSHTD